MLSKSIITTLFLFLGTGCLVYGQSDKEKAFEKGKQAVKLEDQEKYDEALVLLNEAQQLDPERYSYPYEMGYTYYMKKEYPKALDKFKEVITYKNISDQCYQMLGNIYDVMGDSANAMKSYDEGLKKFPKSGRLYLEKGNVYWGKKEYEKALPFYEQGIEADPAFSSNYYRAARIYCSSTEEVWGMIYGEIFINLERNSERTAEISKLLFDTYKSEIKFTGKNSMTVSFCQRMTMNINDIKDTNNIKLPFCMIYEPTLSVAVAMEKKIDLNSLDRIRTNFEENYFKMGHNKTHPNVLFDYQDKIVKAGHFEAYNHWLLMKGDEKEFNKWQSADKEKFDAFVKWFTDNQLTLDDSNKFFSGQY
jgi:tetratricopeptide (TPR) repeat protein